MNEGCNKFECNSMQLNSLITFIYRTDASVHILYYTMKTRQKSRIEERNPDARSANPEWRLDLELDRQDLLRDLEYLASISSPGHKSDSLPIVLSLVLNIS